MKKGFRPAITLVKSLEASLDKSAIEAVSKWRFKPGMKDGKLVAVQVLIDVGFHPLVESRSYCSARPSRWRRIELRSGPIAS